MKQSADDSEKAIKGGAEGAEESIGKALNKHKKIPSKLKNQLLKLGLLFYLPGKSPGQAFLLLVALPLLLGLRLFLVQLILIKQ